jgi:phospholipid/cholesterol/gamma-HCH transport system substrate-binding protein
VIRRGVKIQLAVFLVITVVGISFVGARYIGLGDLFLGSGYVVTVDLPESGGIFENAEVTYRGVAVGRVDRLRLADNGVHVDLRLERGVTVPRDTDAVVENRSAVGEQYVDLQPRTQGGPFLADGDRIASDRTRTPLHVETLLLNLDRLVNSVDRRDLVVVIDQLGRAFSGTGPDLQRLLDSGDALTRSAVDALPETIRLIEDGQTVLATQRDTGSAIASFSHDLADLSDTLRTSDGDLRKVLDNGVVASQELQTLIRTNRTAISACWRTCWSAGRSPSPGWTASSSCWSPTRTTWPAATPWSPGDGTSHFGLVLNAADPPVCTQGYGGTDKRTPQDTSTSPPTPTHAARCRGAAPRRSGARRTRRRPRDGPPAPSPGDEPG